MSKTTVKPEELGRMFGVLKRKIKTAIFDGTAKAYNDGITMALRDITVTGRTVDDWNSFGEIKTGSRSNKRLIGVFHEGLSAKANQSGGHNMWLNFEDEPGLEEWASIVNPSLLSSDGMFVGKSSTHWGTPRNQWLYNGKKEMRFFDKIYCVDELMKIKSLR